MTCTSHDCGADAVYRVFWPGQPSDKCQRCTAAMITIACAMGLDLAVVRLVDPGDDIPVDELAALLEVARLRAWLRDLAAMDHPDAVGMVERIIASDGWPAGAGDGHGARRTGGLRDV